MLNHFAVLFLQMQIWARIHKRLTGFATEGAIIGNVNHFSKLESMHSSVNIGRVFLKVTTRF